jgi:hypothetical protein
MQWRGCFVHRFLPMQAAFSQQRTKIEDEDEFEFEDEDDNRALQGHASAWYLFSAVRRIGIEISADFYFLLVSGKRMR